MGNKQWAGYKVQIRGRSKAGFYGRLPISDKEGNEAEKWLALNLCSGALTTKFVHDTHQESPRAKKNLVYHGKKRRQMDPFNRIYLNFKAIRGNGNRHKGASTLSNNLY